MPASYPTSIKSFTTKSNGTTIDASHVNDLQLEVTAIETDLIAGLSVVRGGTGQTAYGTAGQVLTSAGNGNPATWADPAASDPDGESVVLAVGIFG